MTPATVIQIILCLAFIALIGLVFYLLDEREKDRKTTAKLNDALKAAIRQQRAFQARVDSEANSSLSSASFKGPPS